jgi:DNA-binding transcriptional regulator YiaG
MLHARGMPNLVNALKQEIVRIARKELRTEVASLRKAVSTHRSELARIKRDNTKLEQEVRRLRRDLEKLSPAAEPDLPETAPPIRYSAERLAAARAKLGMTAADFGLLVGASTLSVYKWEKGTRPQKRFLPVLTEVVTMGKRVALARLDAIKFAT